MRSFPFFLLLALFMVACGGNTATEAAPEEAATEEQTATSETPAAAVSLTPMPETPSYPGSGIKGMKFYNGRFNFGITGGEDDYKLGVQTPNADQLMCANSAKGQHLHLIVNDEPYAAKYESNFDYEIADGVHHILAFISRSYHESIKHEGASVAIQATVAGNSIIEDTDITEPMLFYSRPKGTYTGKDAENVMLDFYPVNVELGDGYQVKVEVAGETFMVDKWQPYYFKGLPMGEHTVVLTLVDAEGNAVDAPLNPVQRVITLKEDKGDS